jgi:hypothetical protein
MDSSSPPLVPRPLAHAHRVVMHGGRGREILRAVVSRHRALVRGARVRILRESAPREDLPDGQQSRRGHEDGCLHGLLKWVAACNEPRKWFARPCVVLTLDCSSTCLGSAHRKRGSKSLPLRTHLVQQNPLCPPPGRLPAEALFVVADRLSASARLHPGSAWLTGPRTRTRSRSPSPWEAAPVFRSSTVACFG